MGSSEALDQNCCAPTSDKPRKQAKKKFRQKRNIDKLGFYSHNLKKEF